MMTSASRIIAIGSPVLSISFVLLADHGAMLVLHPGAIRHWLTLRPNRGLNRPFRDPASAGKGRPILEQHKCNVLVMGAIKTVGEIARSFGHAYNGLLHEITLSDYLIAETQ